MSHYKFRITEGNLMNVENIDEIETLLKSFCSHILRVREGDGRIVEYHYHYYLIVSGKYNTLRKKVKEYIDEVFDDYKNVSRMWSFSKIKDFEGEYCKEYIRYMCKDGIPDRVLNIPEEWVIQGRKDALEYKKEVKKEKGGVFRTIVKMLDEKKIYCEGCYNTLLVVEAIIDYYVKTGNKFTKFGIESIATTYFCMRNPHYKQELARKIINNIMM